MRSKSFKIGKTNGKPEVETGQEETITVNEVTDMEEKIANKMKKLKDAIKQLKGLADLAKSSEEYGDETPGQHRPPIELAVESDDDFLDMETEAELNTLMATDAKEEVNSPGNLTNSPPEVSVQELINELEEIKEMIRERQQS
jgi:hypothetical protein